MYHRAPLLAWSCFYHVWSITLEADQYSASRGYHLLVLYIIPNSVWNAFLSLHTANIMQCIRFFLSSFSKHLNLPGIYVGTHAYALSNEGAKKIILIDTPLQYGFDTTLMHASYHKLVNSYSLKKPLFIPNPIFKTSLTN